MTGELIGLQGLEAQVLRELDLLAYPDKQWVRPLGAMEGREILDCAIIGGGQVGLSIGFGLARERVTNIRIFDENKAGAEGPWATFARMLTLRTPKLYSGPENGLPSLTFRAWYEAQFGVEGWGRLFRVGRKDWMNYLIWYRRVLGLPVQNEAKVTAITPLQDQVLRLDVQGPEGAAHILARTVVIATGAAGVGSNYTPPLISSLPRQLWRHTNDSFDPGLFEGKRVGILGAGASAFDNAAAAMEAGALSVDLCFRRKDLPLQNPRRFLEFAGFLAHYRDLPDDQKWRYLSHLYTISQPPPAPTFERAIAFPEVSVRPATPWLDAAVNERGEVEVATPQGKLTFDFVIAATGVKADLRIRPELAGFIDKVALWGDRYRPPQAYQNDILGAFPYLGANGQLLEKKPGEAPWLRRIFMMNRGATLSLGPTIASNSALRYATPMVVSGVTSELFLDGAGDVLKDLVDVQHNELTAEVVGGHPIDSAPK